MKRKNIVAIVGERDHKLNDFISGLCKNRFKQVSINEKVAICRNYVIRNGVGFTTEEIRQRGYKVNKLYWINMLLSSIKDDEHGLLIVDMSEMDIVDDIMKVYYSSNSLFIQGCTNIYTWDEDRVNKEISRLIRP